MVFGAAYIISFAALSYLHELGNQKILAKYGIPSKIIFFPNGLNTTQDYYYHNESFLYFSETMPLSDVPASQQLTDEMIESEDPTKPSLNYMNVFDVQALTITLALAAELFYLHSIKK